MSDEVKRVILNQTVIDDTEAQFAGDVEAPLPSVASAGAQYRLAARYSFAGIRHSETVCPGFGGR